MSPAPAAFGGAVEAYLDHLRVERGLARNTLRAYASDLRLFGERAPGIAGWDRGAEPAPLSRYPEGRPAARR